MNIEKHRAFIESLSPDLKEKVKELMRDAMDAQNKYDNGLLDESTMHFDEHETFGEIVEQFRSLCAPDKGGEVKP